MTMLPPSPFISALEAAMPEESVAGPETGPQVPAAGQFEVSPGSRTSSLPSGESDPSVMLDWGPGENHPVSVTVLLDAPTTAAAGANAAAASLDDTDCIHEIFHHARKLVAEDRRFVLDADRFRADIEPPPLFLQRAAE